MYRWPGAGIRAAERLIVIVIGGIGALLPRRAHTELLHP